MLKAVNNLKQEEGSDDQNQVYNYQRQRYTRQIRKAHRQDIFAQSRIKRMAEAEGLASQENQGGGEKKKVLVLDNRWRKELSQMLTESFKQEQMPGLVGALCTENILTIHYGVIGLRKLCLTKQRENVQRLIELKGVTLLAQLAKAKDYPQICHQAVWAICNLTSNNLADVNVFLMEMEVVPTLVSLLDCPTQPILNNVIWALQNLAYCSSRHNSIILRKNAHNILLKILNTHKSQQIRENTLETLCIMCRNHQDRSLIEDTIQALVDKLIHQNLDLDNQELILESLFRTTTWGNISFYFDSGVIPKLMEIFLRVDCNEPIIIFCLRNLGTITSAEEEAVEKVLNLGLLAKLEECLSSNNNCCRRESCWVLSNICATSKKHSLKVVNSPEILKKLLRIFECDSHVIKKEALFVVTNIAMEVREMLGWLQQHQVYQAIIDMLDDVCKHHNSLTKAILQNIERLLSLGKKDEEEQVQLQGMDCNRVSRVLMQRRGGYVIEELQTHDDPNISIIAQRIMGNYFSVYLADTC